MEQNCDVIVLAENFDDFPGMQVGQSEYWTVCTNFLCGGIWKSDVSCPLLFYHVEHRHEVTMCTEEGIPYQTEGLIRLVVPRKYTVVELLIWPFFVEIILWIVNFSGWNSLFKRQGNFFDLWFDGSITTNIFFNLLNHDSAEIHRDFRVPNFVVLFGIIAHFVGIRREHKLEIPVKVDLLGLPKSD